jgi:urease accessory protein
MARFLPTSDRCLPARSTLVRFAASAALAAPLLAMAHIGPDGGLHHGALQSALHGFAHPFSGADHLVAMLAVGIWSALAFRRVWVAPLAFVAVLLIGALLGRSGVVIAGVEPMIAASLLALGLLVASGVRLPMWAGALIAGAFALFHGAAHGQELQGGDGLMALAGMVAATALLHVAGVGLGAALKQSGRWLPRLAGLGIAAFGAALIAQAV